MADFSIKLAKSLLDSEDDFPVDFNEAWQWLDISEKKPCKA